MRYGLIGEHLSHSYSCEIHAKLSDDPYVLKELAPEELPAFLEERDFCGINVTIPYKKDVIPYLDTVSEDARAIGAVNTIVNRDGVLAGYNTDLYGVIGLIRRAGISVTGKKVLIAGTGGTSLTVAYAMRQLGAKEIFRVSRAGRGGDIITYEEAYAGHSDAAVLFNTTPLGMYPRFIGQKPFDLSRFPQAEGVLDAVYHPLSTPLILDAHARGIPAQGGLFMLVTQAIYAAALFRGKKPDADRAEEVYTAVRKEKENITLIGMPSSGKSSVGRALARLTGRPFLDTDEMLTARFGMSIKDYFATNGESAFRAEEKKAVAEAAAQSGTVIATGGGVVLDHENIEALRQNGPIVFLDRPLSLLCATADRPLSSDKATLTALYEKRLPLYTAAADKCIPASGSVEETAGILKKELGI